MRARKSKYLSSCDIHGSAGSIFRLYGCPPSEWEPRKEPRGDSVDECEGVLHRADQTENPQCVVFEGINLKVRQASMALHTQSF